jgi:hypothetical protein
MFFPAARTTLRAAAGVARRGYADVADGALKLSLVLPHQVSSPNQDNQDRSSSSAAFSSGEAVAGVAGVDNCPRLT